MSLRSVFDIDLLIEKVKDLEEQSINPDFWNNVEESQKVFSSIKEKKDVISSFDNLKKEYEDIGVLIEMGFEENDESIVDEVSNMMNTIKKDLEELRISSLLNEPYDKNNAILTLHPGAGGTESQDWAQMLLRMYTRWAEKKGYKVKILDYLEGDEAGIKSVTLLISGQNAYGFLKSEKGVHRLVRISPFDSSGRRHTSFASAEVIPEINEDIKIEIKSDDIRIDTYRASGAGGQHVNKTDSAIRITHMPTEVVVQCQSERSQTQNKETAMKMLKAKLFELREKENLEKMNNIKGEQKGIGFGSQIRSYVFHPYTLVKDHRTNHEIGNINAVMDGEIDSFINIYLNK